MQQLMLLILQAQKTQAIFFRIPPKIRKETHSGHTRKCLQHTNPEVDFQLFPAYKKY